MFPNQRNGFHENANGNQEEGVRKHIKQSMKNDANKILVLMKLSVGNNDEDNPITRAINPIKQLGV
jgi:hypothetical protein